MKKKSSKKRNSSRKGISKQTQEKVFERVPFPVPTDDLERRIINCLFKVIGNNQSEVRKIVVQPGDQIRGEDMRLYTIQESRPSIGLTTPIKVKPILLYEFISYPWYNRQKTPLLKPGISVQEFVNWVTIEVKDYLRTKKSASEALNSVNTDYVLNQLRHKTISKGDRKRRRIITELCLPSSLMQNERQMVFDLISILQDSTDGMDSDRMIFYYLAKILHASGIEKGNQEVIERNLQAKYRDLIRKYKELNCPDQHLS